MQSAESSQLLCPLCYFFGICMHACIICVCIYRLSREHVDVCISMIIYFVYVHFIRAFLLLMMVYLFRVFVNLNQFFICIEQPRGIVGSTQLPLTKHFQFFRRLLAVVQQTFWEWKWELTRWSKLWMWSWFFAFYEYLSTKSG